MTDAECLELLRCAHESLPEGATGLVRAAGALPLFRREAPPA